MRHRPLAADERTRSPGTASAVNDVRPDIRFVRWARPARLRAAALVIVMPHSPGTWWVHRQRRPAMLDRIATISFDQIALSLLTVVLLREGMILVLPDSVAGPGGWLIDTTPERGEE